MKNFIYLLFFCALFSCKKKDKQQAPSVLPFPVQEMKSENVTTFIEYPVNIEGILDVDIRPQVEGYISEVVALEGQNVKKDAILFKLSTPLLKQQVEAALALVKVAESNERKAIIDVEKLEPLVEKNIISQVQLNTAISNYEAVKSQLNQARANYKQAKDNLDFSVIRSPIDGVVGVFPYRVGSLVGANETNPLTVVSDIDSLRVVFTINEKDLLKLRRAFTTDDYEDLLPKLPKLNLILADGSKFNQEGEIITIGGQINQQTGGVEMKALFLNKDKIVKSGASGKIRMPIQQDSVLLVPQIATYDLQNKKFVYVVGKDDTVSPVAVTTSEQYGDFYIVTKGLDEGQKIVIENVSKLKKGQKIIPVSKNAQQKESSTQQNK
ncbi:efflux RND transporter periplasmic adaptor subunit [Aureivirga sp. CE67]|uniref:efflux RND transporter periplasmic adaptor subunit n=1 Tax=Aureivirga sp. CE67 TaxID=1788983 RepID=UPI0018C8FD1C|nr:efflux RND transporter periplasmic adaptor subunit [Aureivirga sp. CE67]